MKIGFDLDNTIFDYSEAILLAANSTFDISVHSNWNKDYVKTLIQKNFGESEWTRLQGLLYTHYVSHAKIDENALRLIEEIDKSGQHHFEIVSHKTTFPIIGPRVDMRSIATEHFITTCETFLGRSLKVLITYTDSLEEKIQYINSNHFDIFVDDLWEVIEHLVIPHKILFLPSNLPEEDVLVANNWQEVSHLIKVLFQC